MYFPFEYRKQIVSDNLKRKMSIMKSYSHSDKLSVRDNLDDDISDDIEDDVFIRDGKMSKNYEEKRLKRPLMPAKKIKFAHQKTNKFNAVPILFKKKTKCWTCCEPLCYGFIAITILLALIFLAAILLTLFPIPLQRLKLWLKQDKSFTSFQNASPVIDQHLELVPCTRLKIHKIWSKAISRLNSETPIRKVNLNEDGVEDIVIGFGIDEFFQYDNVQAPRCQFSNTQETICEGGLIAFDGATGDTIWQRWTTFTLFSLFCSTDITNDGLNDCIAAGRGGLIIAINGKTGEVIWEHREAIDFDEASNPFYIDLFTVNPVRDLDGDQISDILSAHVEESETKKSGHIKIMSGATGRIIRTIPTPYREEVFVPLQFTTHSDGTESLLIVTGGQNTPGGLYTIRLSALMHFSSETDFTTIFHSDSSGFMAPAVLTDITGDHIEDIIVSSFNSTMYAFDGSKYTQLWNYSFPSSESVSAIVPGHYDHDNITDFLVKYNTGPGFPVYYYSQTTVINGSSGLPMLESMITDSGGPNSLLGGLSISQQMGGDLFLHWQMLCRGKEDSKEAYQFLPDSDVIQQSRADTCLLRFNTSTVLKLYATSRHLEPPGTILFTTDDLVLQLNQTLQKPMPKPKTNPIHILKHPKMRLTKIVENNRKAFKKKLSSEPNIESNRAQNINIINLEEKIPLESKMMSIEQLAPNKIDRPYIYMPRYEDRERDNNVYKLPNNFYDLDQQQKDPSDYEFIYDENERPVRNRRPNNNRGVRRSFSTVSGGTKAPNPETLWDLEIEKENRESLAEGENFNFKERQRRDSSAFVINQNLISSISSTGVLVKSLNSVENVLDLIFVMNVRESETYPPLYLAEDVTCVEEKMRNYQNYDNNDVIAVEKAFLSECLQNRMPNISNPTQQQYETQIVITRISIQCDCETLNKNEACSKFYPVEKQNWTGFMGDSGNGVYPN